MFLIRRMRTVFYSIWLEHWTVHEMCGERCPLIPVEMFLAEAAWRMWTLAGDQTQTTADTNGRSFKILLISDPTARHPFWRLLPRPNWRFSARLWPQIASNIRRLLLTRRVSVSVCVWPIVFKQIETGKQMECWPKTFALFQPGVRNATAWKQPDTGIKWIGTLFSKHSITKTYLPELWTTVPNIILVFRMIQAA